MSGKRYQLVKDGHIISQYSSLAPAKKRAIVDEADIYEGAILVQRYETAIAEFEATNPKEPTGYEKAVNAGLIKGLEPKKPTEMEVAVTDSEEEALPKDVKILVLLNIRKKPGLTEKIIGIAQPGQIYEVFEWENDWFSVKYKGQIGWCWYNNGKNARKI